MRVSVRPLDAVVVGDIGRVLWVVLGAAGLVLAIACANVGNLFLVRAEGRRNALAVQRALGAGPGLIFLEFLSEGLARRRRRRRTWRAVAIAGVEALRSLGSTIDIPRLAEVSVDATVLGVAGTPHWLGGALRERRSGAALERGVAVVGPQLGEPLDDRGPATPSRAARSRRVAGGARAHRARGLGLMARSVWRLRSVQPGFDPASAISFRLALPSATYPGADDSVRFFVRAVDGIAAIPGVRAAGAASKLPLDEQGRTDTAVFVEDRPIPPGSLPGIHPVFYVTPGYFGAAGIPFITGRSFTRPDPPRVRLEAIVSRAFAERYWKDQSPIGRRVRILSNGPWYTVVGVVGNVRDRALDQPEDEIDLLSSAPRARGFAMDAARSRLRRADRGRSRRLDGRNPRRRPRSRSVPARVPRPRADRYRQRRRPRAGRSTFLLIAGASGVALLLGAIGVYGVMSYVVTLRTREIGIRLALGAQPDEVRRMVSRQGLAVAALGIASGSRARSC